MRRTYFLHLCEMPKKGKKKIIPGLDDDSEGLLQTCAHCWGLPTTTNFSFKSQHWKLDIREEDTFGDQCVCSFKQPLVQKMSTKMNSWLKHHEFSCLHEIAFIAHVVLFTFFGENSVFNRVLKFLFLHKLSLSGCWGGDAPLYWFSCHFVKRSLFNSLLQEVSTSYWSKWRCRPSETFTVFG